MLQSLAAALIGNPAFAGAMIGAMLLSYAMRHDPRMPATTAVLAGNWLLGTIFVVKMYDPAHPWAQLPWTWFLAIDYIAAFCLVGLPKVLETPISKAQALVAFIYAMMAVRHVAYFRSGMSEWATYQYSWQLTWAATAQFLVVNVWGLRGLAHRRGWTFRRASHSQTGASASAREGS